MKVILAAAARGLGWLISIILVPGITYVKARGEVLLLGPIDETTLEMKFDYVPRFDRWAFMTLSFLASLGYGLATWYCVTQGWSFATVPTNATLTINGLPIILKGVGYCKLRRVQTNP
jgi:hypothetical protein